MADIFISYAREDEVRARQLAHTLEEQGWSVFWDRRIPAGQIWRTYIGQALRDASCVIVAWSRHSIASPWVIEEAEEGRRRGILVPILLEVIEPPLGFRSIQAGDLTGWQPDRTSPHFEQLVQDIKTVLRVIPKQIEEATPASRGAKIRQPGKERGQRREFLSIFSARHKIQWVYGVLVGLGVLIIFFAWQWYRFSQQVKPIPGTLSPLVGGYVPQEETEQRGKEKHGIGMTAGLLEVPSPQSSQSGIGIVSGWRCEAKHIYIEIDAVRFQALYGTEREDTAGVCGDDNNGFMLLINWNSFGSGVHRVQALADGVVFSEAEVTISTMGTEFLRGVSREYTLADFPRVGDNTVIRWEENLQNFVIARRGKKESGQARTESRVLMNPQPGSSQSGIVPIYGFVCEARQVFIEIDSIPRQAAYGFTWPPSWPKCGDTENGFALWFNLNLLGDGAHTVRALADGVEFANATFTVTTFGTEFLREVSRTQYTLQGFPQAGTNVLIKWEAARQNFIIVGTETGP
jgi:hypothetical protein